MRKSNMKINNKLELVYIKDKKHIQANLCEMS